MSANRDLKTVAQGLENMRANGHFIESAGAYQYGSLVNPKDATKPRTPLYTITDLNTCLTFLSTEDFAKITTKFSGAELIKKFMVLNTHHVNNNKLEFGCKPIRGYLGFRKGML
jgi:hypothetical protein